jgi:tetratricopeptide (TPR) repeat protein
VGRALVWLGLDDARRVLQSTPEAIDGWKDLGLLDLFREPPAHNSPRYRAQFDPVFDLSIVRATYALRRALELAPNDVLCIFTLKMAYDARLMHEAVIPLLDQLKRLTRTSEMQALLQAKTETSRAEYQSKMGSAPPTEWRNLSELDQIVTAQLATGRAESAARLLEQTNPTAHAPWEVLDRIATLWLHLGKPARARELWQKAVAAPQPAVPVSRIATTYVVEGDFEAARRHYQQALALTPNSFEATYCLAVLEQDAGDAESAYVLAHKAIVAAPDEAARSSARVIAAGVARFARRIEDVAENQHELSAPGSAALSP